MDVCMYLSAWIVPLLRPCIGELGSAAAAAGEMRV